jgi:hypothetical protein
METFTDGIGIARASDAGLPTCNFDQCLVGGDKAMNVARTAKQKPRPPGVP